MDRMTIGRRTLNAQRPRVDRFVTPRESYPEIRRRMLWSSRCNQRVDDIWCAKYLQQKKYMNYLDEAFGLEPLKSQEFLDEKPQKCLQFWPCIPREKTFLSSAESILDLPSYRHAIFPDLLDWSNDNILVAALGITYHKWSWQTQSLISHGRTLDAIQCCKFDPRGEYLLLGTELKSVEVHDNILNKWLHGIHCQCQEGEHEMFCSITALDWSPTGNSFAIGCSRGRLSSISRQFDVIRIREVMRGVLLLVRVSPDARYVAVTCVNGKTVLVLTWPGLQSYTSLNSDSTVKSLTWHPWRSALLGIGSTSSSLQARVALWDAPSGQIREFNFGHSPYCLDSMLFSHKTGELVLSLWNSDRAVIYPRACSQLLVMSDPDSVVDQWGEGRTGMDRVRTMVFSPDGTKLATATADEDLVIWNFISDNNIKKKKRSTKFYYSLPVYLDQVSYGASLR